mgnify:CR=1 FL=1
MSNEELFNYLAQVYVERELLINKTSDGKISLSEAEMKIDDLIGSTHLLKLLRMLDRFFLIKGKSDSVKITRSYRYRLNQFINRTIGIEKYTSLLGLSKEELEARLREDVEKLLRREDSFPLLEAQLNILLKWFRR